MADQLGEAVLKIRVDDGDALRKLGELKTELSEFEARTTRSRQAAAAPIKPKSGLTEFLRELRTREQAETAADRRIARRREEAAARLRSEAVRGSVRVVGSPRFTARGARQGGPREDVRALEIAQERRFRIARRIDLLEENGVNVSRLRNRLGVLTDAQSRRQFGTFRQISQELRRQVTLEERRLATQRRQQREASRGARQGGASESITALFDAQRRRYSLDQQIRSLEAAGVNTEKLRTRLGEVTEAQGKRRFGTAKKLGQELNFQLQKERDILSTRQRQERAQTRQARAAEAETRRIARLNASPVLGGVAFPGSPNAIRARDAEARRIARLNTLPVLGLASIPDSPAGIRAAELRRKNEERRAREAERRRQSQEQRQLAEGRRIGRLNASPVRGGAAFPGSPAFLAAQKRAAEIEASRGGIQKGAAESLSTREAVTNKLYQLANRINLLEAKGVDISAQRAKFEQIIEAGKQGQFGTGRQLIQNLARQLSLEENALKVARAREATEKRRAQGATGTASITRSPATQATVDAILERRAQLRSLQTAGGGGGGLTSFLRDVRQREEGERRIAAIRKAGYKDAEFAEKVLSASVGKRTKLESALLRIGQEAAGRETRTLQARAGGALGSALIGGGFPLLFGQGVGAAAGGLAGGALGGAIGGQFGFGLSIVGTIVGDAFDEALNKGKTLAAGLSDPIGKFDELRQAGLISSKALEKNISSLIAQGREAEAAAKIQLDLANNFGDTSELTALNNAYDELGRAFSQLSVITAKFVAGPLADFINKLAASFKVFSARALFEERLQGASPEVQAAARRQVRQRASALAGSGLSLAEVGTESYAAGLTFLDQQLGKTKEVQRAEAAVAAAVARQNTLRSLSFQQIDAQVQGYDRLNLELEKQRIEQQRLQDLSIPKADADRINAEAAQATYRVQSQINDLAKERVAIATEEAAKYQLAGEKLKQELQAVQALAALSQNAQRTAQFAVQQSTLSTIQGIEASVGDARRREREIGAQIDAARLRGGDAGEQEAARLVNEQKLAATQTRIELEKGSLALTQAGIKLREDVDAAFLSLQKLRTGAGGLNQFLTPQDRVNQERRTFEQLLPSFREAQAQFRQLRGVNYAPEFSGSTAGVNQSILQFIDAVKTEQQAVDSSVDTQRALNVNTEKLAAVNADLAVKVAELNAKEWVVQVNANVPYDAQSQLEINRAASLP